MATRLKRQPRRRPYIPAGAALALVLTLTLALAMFGVVGGISSDGSILSVAHADNSVSNCQSFPHVKYS